MLVFRNKSWIELIVWFYFSIMAVDENFWGVFNVGVIYIKDELF